MLTFQTRQEALNEEQVALIVAPNGSIDRVALRIFEKQLEDYLQVGYKWVVLNCASVELISSSGLQVILKMMEHYQEAGGMFLIIQASPEIVDFFDMVGFSPIFENQEQAIACFQEHVDEYAPEQTTGMRGEEIPESLMHTSKRLRKSPLKPAIDIKIDYYCQMNLLKNFPLTVTLKNADANISSTIINVVPYFPGCLVVPEFRSLTLYKQQEQELTFWVTTLVKSKFEGWIEFWTGEERGCYLPLECQTRTQTPSKFLVLLTLATCILWYWQRAYCIAIFESVRHLVPINSAAMFTIAIVVMCIIAIVVSFFLLRPRRAQVLFLFK